MTKKQDLLPLVEILRRLAVARTLLPESIAYQPEDQTWDMLAALLVNDDKIFERVEAMVADKKRGRPKTTAEEAKHPPELLVQLADAFDKFSLRQLQDAARIGNPKPSQYKLVAPFRTKAGKGFAWLPESDQTVLKLVQKGRSLRKWPRRRINGKNRILHPMQASALAALIAAPLDTDGATAKAANAILSLRHDRKDDIAEIENLQMLYTLRGHAIRTMFGGPPLPLLHRSAKEIRDE